MLITIIVSNRKNGRITALYQLDQSSYFEAKIVFETVKFYPYLKWVNRTTAQNDCHVIQFKRAKQQIEQIEFIQTTYADIMNNTVKEILK